MTTQAAPARVIAGDRPARRSAFSGAWLVTGGLVASGVLTYAFFVLAARALGPEAFGRIALMWGVMFVAAVMLFRPLEQTLSREAADRVARGRSFGSVVRVTSWCAGGLVLAVGAAGIAAWGPVTDRLFGGDAFLTGMMIVGIVVYGLSYVVRGLVGGIRWFGGYALTLVVDAVTRLAVAVPLVWYASRSVAAAAIVSAGVASIAIPLIAGRRRITAALQAGTGDAGFRLGGALAFAGPASLIAAADQLLVNGSPLLVTLDGGADASAAAGVVFAATILVRAPVYVFAGVAASLLPNLTHMHAAEERSAFRAAMWRATRILSGLAVLIVAGTFALGPPAMDLLYGAGFEAGRTDLTLLAVGVGVYLLSSTYSQALLALDRGSTAALGWGVSAVVFIGVYLAMPGAPLARISAAFALAAVAGLSVLAGAIVRVLRSPSG